MYFINTDNINYINVNIYEYNYIDNFRVLQWYSYYKAFFLFIPTCVISCLCFIFVVSLIILSSAVKTFESTIDHYTVSPTNFVDSIEGNYYLNKISPYSTVLYNLSNNCFT